MPENGDHTVRRTTISFVYDHDTHQVGIEGDQMPISLSQMITGEGMRLLEEQRKIAAVREIRRALAEAARTQAIVDSVTGGR